MHKSIGADSLAIHLDEVLDEVIEQQVSYVLMRHDHPEAVLVPYEEFQQFETLREQGVLDRFSRSMARLAARNAAYSEEEVAADVDEALREVRANHGW